MRTALRVLILVAALGAAHAAAGPAGGPAKAETISCQHAENFPDGGRRRVVAQLRYHDDRLVSVSLVSSISDGSEGGGYQCGIAATTMDPGVIWSREGSVDLVDTSTDANSVSIAAIATRRHLAVIATERLSRYYCGFGAEWPKYVIVPRRGGKCVVKMSD